jgi:hypothetical protein
MFRRIRYEALFLSSIEIDVSALLIYGILSREEVSASILDGHNKIKSSFCAMKKIAQKAAVYAG